MDEDGIDLQSAQGVRPIVTGEGVYVPFQTSLHAALLAVERAFIVRALADADHNLSETALRLGISRRTLYNKLYAHQLVQRKRMRRRWVIRRWPPARR